MRTQIASFRQIETNKSTSWICYVGGGSGPVSILLIVICCLVCWRCKHHQSNDTKSPPLVAYTAPGNPKMVHTREGSKRTRQRSALCQSTVGFKDPVGNRRLVMDHETENALASPLFEQFEDLGTNVKEHHRRLIPRQYSAIPPIEN